MTTYIGLEVDGVVLPIAPLEPEKFIHSMRMELNSPPLPVPTTTALRIPTKKNVTQTVHFHGYIISPSRWVLLHSNQI